MIYVFDIQIFETKMIMKYFSCIHGHILSFMKVFWKLKLSQWDLFYPIQGIWEIMLTFFIFWYFINILVARSCFTAGKVLFDRIISLQQIKGKYNNFTLTT